MDSDVVSQFEDSAEKMGQIALLASASSTDARRTYCYVDKYGNEK